MLGMEKAKSAFSISDLSAPKAQMEVTMKLNIDSFRRKALIFLISLLVLLFLEIPGLLMRTTFGSELSSRVSSSANQTFGVQVLIKEREGTMKQEGFEMKVVLPLVIIEGETELPNLINRQVEEIFYSYLQGSSQYKAKTLDIEYDSIQDRNYFSILIKASYVNGFTYNKIASVNFDTVSKKLIALNDILGVNGALLASDFIEKQRLKNPSGYPDQPISVSQSQSFYIKENAIHLLFDENNAPKLDVVIPLNQVSNYSIHKEDYYTKESYGLKMLPLRNICEIFNFNVKWGENSIEISRGSFSTSLRPDENKYTKGKLSTGRAPTSLEAAPELFEGRTYVPISFFSEILGLIYSSDESGTITFSEIREQEL